MYRTYSPTERVTEEVLGVSKSPSLTRPDWGEPVVEQQSLL